MEIWQKFIIETQYTSIDVCVSSLNKASNKQGTKFWNQGIIGELNSKGEFDFILNRGRYKEYHYVGSMQIQNDKVVLLGHLKPLVRNVVILKLAVIFFALAMVYEFVSSISLLGITGAFIEAISMLGLVSLGLGLLYLMFRLNAYIAGTKIKERLQSQEN